MRVSSIFTLKPRPGSMEPPESAWLRKPWLPGCSWIDSPQGWRHFPTGPSTWGRRSSSGPWRREVILGSSGISAKDPASSHSSHLPLDINMDSKYPPSSSKYGYSWHICLHLGWSRVQSVLFATASGMDVVYPSTIPGHCSLTLKPAVDQLLTETTGLSECIG